MSRTRLRSRTSDCPACDADNGGLSNCGPCRFHDCNTDTANCGQTLSTDGGRIIQKLVIEHVPDDIETPDARTAYRKGALAARHNELRDSCPYPDHRHKAGQSTVSKSLRKEWHRGYDREQEGPKP